MIWQRELRLAREQPPRPLRDLLQRQWLLPKRVVHFLRLRHQVLVNGRYRPVSTLIGPGDQITLAFRGDEFRTPQSTYRSDDRYQLPILYENPDLVVVNKPAGLKAHPNRPGERGTVMNAVAAYLQDQPGAAAYMVHRLDQATSGAMIVAKTPVVVPILDRLIASGQIHRRYLAVTAGIPQPRHGELTGPIGADPHDVRKRQVNGVGAQPARTRYRVVKSQGSRALVRLRLLTGRTHQLRVHLATAGWPIVGDPLYGTVAGLRMLLHGVAQELVVPFSGKRVLIQAPLPPDFPADLL